MFERIVVPLDGSRLSTQAIPYATEVGKRFGAEIILVRVILSLRFSSIPQVKEGTIPIHRHHPKRRDGRCRRCNLCKTILNKLGSIYLSRKDSKSPLRFWLGTLLRLSCSFRKRGMLR